MTKLIFDERELSRERMSRKRAAARDLHIPRPENPERRAACLADIYTFLQTYFSDAFYHPFTDGRREMVEAILQASHVGGDQGIAAPRGDGKTTIVECVTIYELLKGNLRFPIIVAATGPDAKRILSNIKRRFEDDASNELFHADFPEVCIPIVDLRGAPQKAGKQTVDGEPTFAKWSDDYVVFPRVPKKYNSAIAGAVLMTRGLDAAIRGIRHGSLRPDLAIIDDPETRESARSELQIANRETAIEQDIGGLGGPGRKLARVMLCTVSNRQCVAYKYTDPKQKPSWHGKRLARLVAKPKREDLWAEYCAIRQGELSDGGDGAQALAYYQEHRAEMDEGAVVTNPYDFVEPGQISALQKCYDIIADRGWDNFATEYQNDPPEQAGPQEIGITPKIVAERLSGLDRMTVPEGYKLLTAGIDLGKYKIHWTVTAWRGDATGAIVDYGLYESDHDNIAKTEAVENAIRRGLHDLREQLTAKKYCTPAGETIPLQLALVDSGKWTKTVYAFVLSLNQRVFKAAKGFGKTADGSRGVFRPRSESTPERRYDEGLCYALQTDSGVWLTEMDADHWKGWVHERFMTPENRPGSLILFGNNPRDHHAFAHHICAEVEREEWIEGKGLRRYWHSKSDNNHWLDATYMACVAAALHGVRLTANTTARRVQKQPQKKPTGFLSRPGGWIQGMQ